MKSILKALFFSATLGVFTISCNEPEVKENPVINETVKTEIIDFMGEKVSVSQDFPKELLNQTNEDFKEYYFSLHQIKI